MIFANVQDAAVRKGYPQFKVKEIRTLLYLNGCVISNDITKGTKIRSLH